MPRTTESARPVRSGRSSRARKSPSPTFREPRARNPSWHTKGTVSSADPKLIDGLANAAYDYVSLANNHIRDAGGQGLLQTTKNVTKRGIEVSGAGKDLAAARRLAMLEAGGVKVAVLGYDAIAGGYHATATEIGSAPLQPTSSSRT